jgi:hypothetical protein
MSSAISPAVPSGSAPQMNKTRLVDSIRDRWSSLFPILTSLLLAISFLTVPVPAPHLGVDPSWCGVLQWAHERGVHFGSSLVFTYGPLGYLLAPYCLTPPSTALVLVNLALCFAIALGLCLVAWRLEILWRIVLLTFVVLQAANAEMRADLLLQIGLFCWGLLCLLESGRRQTACAGGLIALTAFAGLTKVVYLFVAPFSVCVLALYLGVIGRRRLACALPPALVMAFLIAWICAGQSVSHVISFLQNALPISREYDQAAGLEGLPALRFWGLVLGLSCLAAVFMRIFDLDASRERRALWLRLILIGWVGSLLLVAWKHSMVRMDRLHFFDLAAFGPVAALALEALPSRASRSRTASLVMSLGAGLLSLYIVESFFLPGFWSSCAQVAVECADHTRWIFCPGAGRPQLQHELNERRREAKLPGLSKIVGDATVDVFGFRQAFALLNGFNYAPRPVFQSYVAYCPKLAQLNHQFYLSTGAPEFVLFELASHEHRTASLDDALALRVILASYVPVGLEKGFLLLKRHQSAADPKLTLIQQGRFKLGQQLDLSHYAGNDLWIELDVQPTWWGRLRRLLYRPLPLRLSLWAAGEDSAKRIDRRQASASVMRSGFLCSPFLRNTADVQRLYDGQDQLRPKAISVETGREASGLWQTEIDFKLYTIETWLGSQTSAAEHLNAR